MAINTKMKQKFILILGIALICGITSCGAKKPVEASKYTNPFEAGDYETPCTVFDTAEDFAATGIASGPATQKGSIQLVALKNAQDIVAMKIMHAVEGEVKSFFESVGANKGNDYQQQTIGGLNSIITGIVNNTSACCGPRFSGVDARGNVECYIGIKISKERITEAVVESLSRNERQEIREAAEAFRRQMTEDLRRYRGEE